MLKEGLDKTISVRLSTPILEALANRTLVENKDRAELIREAIVNYLGLPKDSFEERIEGLQQKADAVEKRLKVLEQKLDVIEQDLKYG